MCWDVISTDRLTVSLLMDLFSDKIAAIRVPNFISTELCEIAVQGIQSYGIGYYKDVYPKIGKIGITQNEHKGNLSDKEAYFAKVAQADALRKQVFKESGDLLLDIINTIEASWPAKVEIACEEDLGKQYFAGLVRVINKALVHFDWAPKDAIGWSVSQITAQLAWNLFLQIGDQGGCTRVYHKQWQAIDEGYHIAGSYAYDAAVVHESEYIEIAPRQGEFVLFNSRNFHEVDANISTRERITLSSFIGLSQVTNELLFWS